MLASHRVLILFASVLLGGAFSIAGAQTFPYDYDTRPQRGFMPTADHLTSPLDSIDPVSGKLHFEVPLASLPPGHAGFGFELNLVYDSHFYNMNPSADSQTLSPELTGGWSYNFRNYEIDFEQRPVELIDLQNCLQGENARIYRYRVGLADGSLHILHLDEFGDEIGDSYYGDGFYGVKADGTLSDCAQQSGLYPPNPSGIFTYYTSDGSFLKVETDSDATSSPREWILYFPDGRRVVMDQSCCAVYGTEAEAVYDANGNGIHFVDLCHDDPSICDQPYTAIRDDFGREITVNYDTTDQDFQGTAMVDEIKAQGPNGLLTWTINWQKKTIGADDRKYGCDDTSFGCPMRFDFWGVQYIQLPLEPAVTPPTEPPVWNSYAFGYSDDEDPENGYGEVDFIRTPSGAEYTYDYRLEGCADVTAGCHATEDIVHWNGVTRRALGGTGVTPLEWSYSYNLFSETTITNPDGGVTTYAFHDPGNIQDWKRGLVHRIDQPLGHVVKRSWAQNKAFSIAGSNNTDANNPYVERESRTLGNAAGVRQDFGATAVTDLVYDKNGNLLERREYDWVDYSSTGVETGVTLVRIADHTYHVDVPDAAQTSDDADAYYQPHSALWTDPAGPRRLDAVRRREVQTGAGAIVAATEFDYDNQYTSGNVTAELRWDSEKAATPPTLGNLGPLNSQVLSRAYDAKGNVTDIFAPEVRTRFTYANYPNTANPGPYPTQIDHAYQAAEERTWTYAWGTYDTETT